MIDILVQFKGGRNSQIYRTIVFSFAEKELLISVEYGGQVRYQLDEVQSVEIMKPVMGKGWRRIITMKDVQEPK